MEGKCWPLHRWEWQMLTNWRFYRFNWFQIVSGICKKKNWMYCLHYFFMIVDVSITNTFGISYEDVTYSFAKFRSILYEDANLFLTISFPIFSRVSLLNYRCLLTLTCGTTALEVITSSIHYTKWKKAIHSPTPPSKLIL